LIVYLFAYNDIIYIIVMFHSRSSLEVILNSGFAFIGFPYPFSIGDFAHIGSRWS